MTIQAMLSYFFFFNDRAPPEIYSLPLPAALPISLVRKGGLEPPRAAPPAPKAGASTNSATFASCSRRRQTNKYSRSCDLPPPNAATGGADHSLDRKSTRLNSSHQIISYAVFCLKK